MYKSLSYKIILFEHTMREVQSYSTSYCQNYDHNKICILFPRLFAFPPLPLLPPNLKLPLNSKYMIESENNFMDA